MKSNSPSMINYLWLTSSIFFFSFANGNAVPVAPWLALLLFMRFIRQAESKTAIIIAMAGLCVAHVISLYVPFSNSNIPPVMRVIYCSAFALFIILPPFIADRYLSARIKGIAGTLIFPCAFVTVEYVNSLVSPFSTFGLMAYTQYGNLPLMQVSSITGIWGITFLITWCTSLTNNAWEYNFQWDRIKAPMLIYLSVMTLALSFGGIRLLDQENGSRIKIAVSSYSKNARENFMHAIKTGRGPEPEKNKKIFDRFFSGISATGAEIAVWSEYALTVNETDLQDLLRYVSGKVNRGEIYCTLPVGVIVNRDGRSKLMNTVYLYDPRGKVITRYVKSFTTPWETSTNEEKIIPVVKTDNANLSLTICFDMDFPFLIRQAGKKSADIMLAPSFDWRGIVPFHSHMAVFRAIENGFSLVRSAGDVGGSIATDSCGRVLGYMDNQMSTDKLMVVEVPARGRKTLYSRIGDIFAWFCITALGWLFFNTLRKPGKNGD